MQQATLAQSVEQRIRNAQVVSSSLMSGSEKREVLIRASRFLFPYLRCDYQISHYKLITKSYPLI